VASSAMTDAGGGRGTLPHASNKIGGLLLRDRIRRLSATIPSCFWMGGRCARLPTAVTDTRSREHFGN